MSTELQAYSPQLEREAIKATLGQQLSDVEFELFLKLAEATKLNPFLKEIWAVPGKKWKDHKTGDEKGSAAQIMVGLNGYLRIANDHPMFDGMVKSWQYDVAGGLVSATCEVWRKDRRFPSVGVAHLEEYFRPTQTGKGLWYEKPRIMCMKVAITLAIREAFITLLSGTYTEDEMPPEFADGTVPTPVKFVIPSAAVLAVTEAVVEAAPVVVDQKKRKRPIPLTHESVVIYPAWSPKDSEWYEKCTIAAKEVVAGSEFSWNTSEKTTIALPGRHPVLDDFAEEFLRRESEALAESIRIDEDVAAQNEAWTAPKKASKKMGVVQEDINI